MRRDLSVASAEGTWRHESVRTQIWEEERKMRAADVMTTDVVTVGPDARVVEVAETLLASRISAVPVIGERGELVGIVSEGDLMRRSEARTERRRAWWLEAFGGEDDARKRLRSGECTEGCRHYDS